MSSRISYVRAPLALAASLLAFTGAGPAAAQSAANVAQDFLNKIENGNTGEAFEMLAPSARHGRSAADLTAPSRNPESMRKVAFQGPIDAKEVGQEAPGRYFIVCMLDAPKGSGAITSIAVTVVIDPQSSQPRIADYRYGSHPAPACASRV